MSKSRVYTVTPDLCCAPCTEKEIGNVMVWIKEAEPGAVIKIVVGEMEETEYDKMPEYMGP